MKNFFQFIFSIILIAISLSSFAHAASTTGTTSYHRIISFGDSLSDMGTYALAAGPLGGGKFTTNPGKIWLEVVADHLSLPIKSNRQEGFGLPTRFLGGFGYAQGGSQLIFDSKDENFTARPVAAQIGYFLLQNGFFLPGDLVLIQGGANDIFAQMNALKSGTITPQEAIQNMAQAADDFSVMIANVRNSGAQKLIVVNLPMIEQTPKVLSLDPAVQKIVAAMVATFNSTLATKVIAMKVTLIDFYSFDKSFNLNYVELGFSDITHTACLSKGLPSGSSLFCSPKTLTEVGADQKYKYADGVHPTTGYSKLVGDYIYARILE